MRIALKFAYLGTNFSGFQFQPDKRTVEGELFKALKTAGIEVKEARYKSAGRTDAGVHAFGQVIAIDANKVVLPRVLNASLPSDIVAWAWAKVGSNFNPRKAASRTYIYILPAKGHDISAMRKAARLLLGTHDFTNFTKKFGENCVRTIYNAELRIDGDFLILEIEGNAFTWNMVRCIATTLEAVGSGRRSVEWFAEMLNPEKHKERIEPAPAYGLILKDVRYSGVEFEVDDYAWRALQTRLAEVISYHGTIYKLFSMFVRD
jgi:tRNA pseudouridine38-40 synthase